MKKILRETVAVCLCAFILLSLGACGKKSNVPTSKYSFGDVWSLATTTKVLEEQTDVYGKGPAELTYQAVRNEYESCQLFISAKEDVQSFELESAELKNDDAVISSDNIEIYVQKYVHFYDSSGTGEIPDPLIPMDAAIEYEENKIELGKNGGIWVTIYVPEDAKEGMYTGEFLLKVVTKEKTTKVTIPVSLEVYDYTLTNEVNAKTLFSWRHRQVAVGELDGSNEMMTTYYEFMNEYRISPQAFPLEVLSEEEYMEDVLTYYDQVSTYTLHCYVGHISGELDSYPDLMKKQVLAIAKASTSEKNLFDKLMIYFIDEPSLDTGYTRESVVARTKTIRGYLQECVDIIKQDQTGVYDAFKVIANWEKSIVDIPSVIPMGQHSVQWMIDNEHTPEGQDVLNTLNCICPLFPTFTDASREQVIALTEKYDIELWWYGCVSNLEPTPTYFVGDENLLSSRTVSWLQKKYNIQGNLYWDIAGYTWDQANTGSGYNSMLFEWPDRDGNGGLQAGDGNLVYPGAPYGVYGPLPSLRLMSIRDGMEEYELLLDIERTYEQLADSFGKEFSVENAMDSFYNVLEYDGIKMYADGEGNLDFVALRKQLLKLATNLKTGLGYAMGNVDIIDETANFEIYAMEGARVTIDGNALTPISEIKYQYTTDIAKNPYVQVSVSNTEGKKVVYKQFVGTPQYILNTLSDEGAMDGIAVTEGSKVELQSTETYSADGKSVHASIKGQITGNMLIDSAFVPKLTVGTDLLGENQLTDFTVVQMDVYNPGEAFDATLRLYSESRFVDLGEILIKEGKSTIELPVEQLNLGKMQIDSITFEFENEKEGKIQIYDFYIDNIVGKK